MSATVSTHPRLDLMTVEGHMHAGMIGCDPAARLSTVAWILADEQIQCVIVAGLHRTDDGSQITWGAITDRDLVRALADQDSSLTAADIARPPVVTVEPTERLDRVAELMAAHDLSHVIVTEGVVPVGVITSLAIARAAGLQ